MTPPTPPADCEVARPGRRRDPNRDGEILTAALDVLADTGYEGMTIDMVAARAKAGKATVYRRWESKAELVLEALACLKGADLSENSLPDTGSLRGDLVALIKPHTIEDAERKLRIMSGVVAMISKAPELADSVRTVIVEPRARANRFLLNRAIARGEISAEIDVEQLALITPSMIAYRVLLLREPVNRDYLISLIDTVLLPAAGVRASV
ncbi:TetR/AcrR family transcriptional regulator [Rathayibacter iranicus]|uniref:TetR family transcriptional regulator n=2 Tax=Rathayibacter iranicus TaxID=59737 RepID=A0AAD1ELA0_9MICO|nr:TetR/AcrR family transcriptional regulator [Rathayibacter iranicus]AZZ54811.1 TetR family transcriptional regulator [Rathayibacter iranicus]MWV31375.1 TetR family transcriptional regulator [Rathayibacter iranicus NCPPB 2253 = VKM Ac-1602]PPI50404.1 TetR family transcriptional regulator [Rathayibacter iranicus]PPI62730.1 TetR family transcriptional regulator [Rathayibacter iranicus]PPI73803.1 TetR family transcriptional regulator [Rathayibacter iranicus]